MPAAGYTIYDIVGLVGVLFYISSSALLQAGWLRGSFVGGLSCFTGVTANATVTATRPGRLFKMSRENRLHVTQKLPDLRSALEAEIRQDIAIKLTNTNTRLAGHVFAVGTTP